MAGECVFCRRDLRGIAAEEHIFPQWLLQHLGVSKTEQLVQRTGFTATFDDLEVSKTREHGHWRFVEGRVCRYCNNGWMNQLEIDARPGIERLLLDGGRIVALAPWQRTLLARWAAKTAFLIANVSPFSRPVPPGHLWAINDGGDVPAGVQVFAGQSGTTDKTAYLQSTTWTQFGKASRPAILGALNGAYKIGLQIQDMLLMVAFVPKSGVTIATAAGLHIPLNANPKVWPCYLFEPPDEPFPPLWMFVRSLAAVVI